MSDFRIWAGTDRLTIITRRYQWYVSIRAFGYRIRAHSVHPYLTAGRA